MKMVNPNIDKRDWNREERDAQKKITSPRFKLEEKIANYYPKNNGLGVLDSVKDFLITQNLVYNRLKSEYHNNFSLSVATQIASKVGLDRLESSSSSNLEIFEKKKINFNDHFLSFVSSSLELYSISINHNQKNQGLEEITTSFYDWLSSESLEIMNEFPENKKEFENIEFNILGTSYKLDFTSKTIKSKPLIQLDQFKEETSPIEEFEKPLYEYISGHDDVKTEFLKMINRVKNVEYFTSFISPKKIFDHYLLYGPPGTGKTSLVRSLAENSGFNFYQINCADLASDYLNKTSMNVNAVFEEVSKKITFEEGPGAILFFDEFDYLGRARGSTNSSEDDKVITVLNNWLDGIKSTPKIIFVGGTNRADQIDSAILSRLRAMEVGYPETDEAIIDIHKKIISKIEDYAKRPLFEELDYQALLQFKEQDEKFKSGRAIENVIYTSLKNKLDANIQNGTLGEFKICSDDLLQAYQNYDFKERTVISRGEVKEKIRC